MMLIPLHSREHWQQMWGPQTPPQQFLSVTPAGASPAWTLQESVGHALAKPAPPPVLISGAAAAARQACSGEKSSVLPPPARTQRMTPTAGPKHTPCGRPVSPSGQHAGRPSSVRSFQRDLGQIERFENMGKNRQPL